MRVESRKLMGLVLKRPLCMAVLTWVLVLTVLFVTGRNRPLSGYERLRECLNGQAVMLSGRIRRITGSSPDETYYIDHIRIKNTETYRNTKISSVTYAGEIFLSVPADMKIMVRSGSGPTRSHDSRERRLRCEDQVIVSGTAVFPERPSNPGQFDDELYCRNRDILFRFYDAEISVTQEGKGILYVLQTVRDLLEGGYRSCLTDDEASVMTGITLGDPSQIESSTKDLFREGGIAHVLAISALHVHLLAMSLYRFLRKKAHSFLVCSGISLLFMAAYMVMTGMSHSSVRAFVMFALWCLSQITGRKTDLPTSLALGALILTLRHPGLVAESGFWFSFGCVLSLHLLSDPVRDWLFAKRKAGKRRQKVHKAIASSLAISMGTFPLSAFFSYQVTPWSFLANLVILPCMSLLFIFGCVGSLLAVWQVNAGRFVLSVCAWLVRFFLLICRVERKLPFGVFITGRPGWWQMTAYYAILMIWLLAVKVNGGNRKGQIYGRKHARRQKAKPGRKRNAIVRFMTFAVFFAGGIGVLALRIQPAFSAVFLDVGQGDCTLIRLKGRNYLVDCGSSSVENVWSRRVSPALKYYGIARLDGIFITHGDYDHINGTEELFNTYERNLLGTNCSDVSTDNVCFTMAAGDMRDSYPDEAAVKLAGKAKELRIPVQTLMSGDKILVKDPFYCSESRTEDGIICLYPSRDDIRAAGTDTNMKSMVLEIRYRDVSLLMMGDLEKEGEERFVRKRAGIRSSSDRKTKHLILKAGHHGSGNATTKELLDLLHPETAVISCGRNNRYGHPAQTVLYRLTQAGAGCFRTDMDGAVVVRIYKGTLRCTGWNKKRLATD